MPHVGPASCHPICCVAPPTAWPRCRLVVLRASIDAEGRVGLAMHAAQGALQAEGGQLPRFRMSSFLDEGARRISTLLTGPDPRPGP